MTLCASSVYALVLALWVGGIAIYSVIVTPIIFKSYPKDTAGEIVGRLFGAYFTWNLVLTVLALALFPFTSEFVSESEKWSQHLLIDSFLVALAHKFYVHPKARSIKVKIKSFENESQVDASLIGSFRKLHTVSVLMNVFLLITGIILVVLAS